MEQQAQLPALMTAPAQIGHPWLAGRLLQRQVVNVTTLEPVGRIKDVVLDPEQRQVVSLLIQLERAPRGPSAMLGRMFGRRADLGVITLDRVVSLNGEVVTINADPISPAQKSMFEGLMGLNDICDLVILTTHGMSLGSLTDVLLDYRGSDIEGYVVKPTELAQTMLPPLADLTEQELGSSTDDETPGALPSTDPEALASHLRVIPVAARVHFGESLIMLVSEVEPLRQQVVVVSQDPGSLTSPKRDVKKRMRS